MKTYRVKVNENGAILLPPELRELLGLVAGDTVELNVDAEGRFLVQTAERSAGPLSDFFEDLILGDLRCDGCSGDILKERLLEKKFQLSTVLDRMSEEARRAHKHGQTHTWRENPAFSDLGIGKAEKGKYHVMLTPRTERDFYKLSEGVLKEIPQVLENLEEDPLGFKRLKGPYYETYRVSFHRQSYRVIYTVFESESLVTVLFIGERKSIYERMKGMG
ncbi:hypothetical protein JCM15765_11290 [Paradesulfitobacterium aromaticivorans]